MRWIGWKGIGLKCENLDVWNKAVDISSEIYLSLMNLKDYNFKDQLTRSCLSIPSNIAEGFERYSNKEKVRFLDISRGSVAEAQTQIIIGIRIGYIEKEIGNEWINKLEKIGKMLTNLIISIKERKK